MERVLNAYFLNPGAKPGLRKIKIVFGHITPEKIIIVNERELFPLKIFCKFNTSAYGHWCDFYYQEELSPGSRRKIEGEELLSLLKKGGII